MHGTAGLLLISCLAAAPARASNEIAIRVGSTFTTGSELASVAENNRLTQAELGYARALATLWRGQIWLEGSYVVGHTGTTVFGSIDTSAWFHSLLAGARYAVPLRSWLSVHGRLGLGLAIATMSVEPAGGVGDTFETSSDRAFGLAGHALLGLQLLWPRPLLGSGRGDGVRAGLVLEGGISFSTPLRFAAGPDDDADRVRLPLSRADLGSLNPSGGVLRAGALVRF